jgi:Amidohydrolase family
MESILAATAGVAKLFMREDELGKIQPGYFADCILVDGNPLDDIAVLQDHDKLNVVMINGRIHKASYKEFMRTMPEPAPAAKKSLTNYVSFTDSLGRSRLGHLDMESSIITPLAMASGAPVHTLYEVIELGMGLVPAGEALSLESVKLLPPITGRDVLAVGKNYSEHAKEFNKSGYDASDRVDQRKPYWFLPSGRC